MIIFPAIDLLGGNCVRLVRGEYGSASRVAEDALETAKRAGFMTVGVYDRFNPGEDIESVADVCVHDIGELFREPF